MHDDQLVDAAGAGSRTPATVAAELPVLVVPGLLVADDALLDWLRAYAAAGGHLVLGPRTGYGDAEGRARVGGQAGAAGRGRRRPLPGVLQPRRPAAGGRAERRVRALAGRGGPDWVDGLIGEGAKVLARLPTTRTSGGSRPWSPPTTVSGRITTVGTLPNPALAADLARWLVPDPPDGRGPAGRRR